MATPNVPYFDEKFLQHMSAELQSLAKEALKDKDISASVNGVFSLDDLERIVKAQAFGVGTIHVGVSYEGCQRGDPLMSTGNAVRRDGGGRAALDFLYLIVLAVNSNDCCDGKFEGQQLLHVLRTGILGRRTLPAPEKIPGRTAPREFDYATWDFIKEGPEVGVSDSSMLYYSQVWRASVVVTGNNP